MMSTMPVESHRRKKPCPRKRYALDEHALDVFGGCSPRWMDALAVNYAEHFLPKRVSEVPIVALVPRPRGVRFGGRHMPDENAILLYDTGDDVVTMAVELHELTHWARKRLGDPRGRHDKDFYALLEEVFLHYNIPSDVARDVEQICDEEGSLCGHWGW